MTLYISTPAPPKMFLDLHLNKNLNPETILLHDDIYNVKYRQTDVLYEPV